MLTRKSTHNLLWFLTVSAMSTGLIGACALFEGTGDGSSGNGNDTGDEVPVVMLSVSNQTPQVNEEVTLTCSVVTGTSIGVTFDFQPEDGSLIVNHSTGRALFIVSDYDAGTALAYTCTGTNANGTSRPSAEVVIFPTL